MRSAVTISLVPEARGGPFVFWDDLEGNLAQAAALGFSAVEIFPPSTEVLDARQIRQLLERHNLKLAAVGSGAGWVVRKLRLTDPDPMVRGRAREFIAAIVDFAGGFGASAIVGSMQGRFEHSVSREQALTWLAEALEQLGPRAHARGVPLFFEPLNRYETNLVNSVADGLALLKPLRTKNVKLLCDLFHMNIEEASMAEALHAAGPFLGHVHLADSNRQAAGFGHTDFAPIARALHEISYQGYLSAEVFPRPDSDSAARQTMAAIKRWFQASPP